MVKRQRNLETRAARQVARARKAYMKAEGRVAAIQVRLARAEEKLTRRAARLSTVEETLTKLARPQASAITPAQAADELAACAGVVQMEPATPDGVADDLATRASTDAQENVLTAEDTVDKLVAIAHGEAATKDGAASKSTRSRRTPANKDGA